MRQLALLGGLVLLCTSSARAQEDPGSGPTPGSSTPADATADRLAQGQALFDAGAYPQAAELWTQGFRETGELHLLLRAASAWARAGELDNAANDISRFDADRPQPDEAEAALREAALADVEQARLVADSEASNPPEVVDLGDELPLDAEDVELPSTKPRRSRVPLASVGLIAAGGIGVGLGVQSGQKALEARSYALVDCNEEVGVCTTAAAESLGEARRSALLADIGVGLGSAAIAAGATLLVSRNVRGVDVHAGVGHIGLRGAW